MDVLNFPRWGNARDVINYFGITKRQLTEFRNNGHIISQKHGNSKQSKRSYDLKSVEKAMEDFMNGVRRRKKGQNRRAK